MNQIRQQKARKAMAKEKHEHNLPKKAFSLMGHIDRQKKQLQAIKDSLSHDTE